LVDGPLYVIQLHQAEFTTAVAAVGTVLTLEQLQLLQRWGHEGWTWRWWTYPMAVIPMA
jgi:DNA primase